MTKADLIKEICNKTGYKQSTVDEIIEEFMTVVKDSMETGSNIYLRGFGSFVVKKRARKIARNISRNTEIIIPSHFIPTFKPSQKFIKRVRTTDGTGPKKKH